MQWPAQFLLSALSAAQFPRAEAPEIAFLGRSNVGKSSLLNALVGEKAAKVSSTPGRTRAINFFAVSDERGKRKMVFADLPGYGYAKISKSISAEWPTFIEPYLAERETLGALHLPGGRQRATAAQRSPVAGLAARRGPGVCGGCHQDRPAERQRAHAQPGGAEASARRRGDSCRFRRRRAMGSRSCGRGLKRQGLRD